MKKINIGIIGLGTVGSSVVKTLLTKRQTLKKKTGVEINIKTICDKDITTPRAGIDLDKLPLTRDPYLILNDSDIPIVVELIGGISPAKEYILKALKNGKFVVTANKALLAEYGYEIFKLAMDKNLEMKFEASVAGGIPIVKSITEGLVGNQISEILGIVNGTCNYILTQMEERQYNFQKALQDAKQKGYVEADPKLDIEGIDSCHKLIILSLLAFGVKIKPSQIFARGISNISTSDIVYAKELGYAIKLLIIAKRKGSQLELRVHPTLLPEGHLLAQVKDIFNAIYIKSDLIGEFLLYGKGAGGEAAASGVISDIVDLCMRISNGKIHSAFSFKSSCKIKSLRAIDHIQTRYYIRFMAKDQPGVLAGISSVLGKHNISIASVTQKERRKTKVAPIVMMTHEAKEESVTKALKKIAKLEVIKEEPVAIRVESRE